MTCQPPLLIALPHGLNVSGVTMWAVRLANALAAGTGEANRNWLSDRDKVKPDKRPNEKEAQAQARAQSGNNPKNNLKNNPTNDLKSTTPINPPSGVGLIVHREPSGHDRLSLDLHPGVVVFDARDLPPVEEACGNLEPFVAVYRNAVREMARRFGSPVVLSPNLHGDSYGIAAQLSQTEAIRIVAWQHSDIEYNARLLNHYEHVITQFVAVSDHIGDTLAHRLVARTDDIVHLPYGVEVPPKPPARQANQAERLERHPPVRLIYTGRMEHEQKRVRVLVLLSDELEKRGVAHQLTMVGDGPAADEIDAMISSRAGRIHRIHRIRRIRAASPHRVESLLDEHDIFVLSSRYEGLSVSMLEAMARGCVPVVTRVESGATQVIEEGVNGIITQESSKQSESVVVCSLANAVERAIAIGLGTLSRSAWRTASQQFSIQHHASSVRKMLRRVAESPVRRWPSGTPCAFSCDRVEIGVGSGSVPADGARRMMQTLDNLAGHSVVIYGAGEHTRQLAHIIEASPITLVAIADDDPGKHGSQMLGVPIIALGDITETDANDIVISSWMNEAPMYDAVAAHNHSDATLHRLYE